MRPRLVGLLLALSLVATGCAAKMGGSEQAIEREMGSARAPMAPQADIILEKEETRSGKGGATVPSLAADMDDIQRMIIRTVNLTVIVEDADEALDGVRQLVASSEGYISSSNRWLVGNQAYARVTLRVPAASLDAVLSTIRDMSVKVEEENVSGQDVTEEYVDLQARLVNLRAAEEELRALLTEVRENRGKADEILAIYRELTEIRGQIESLQGRSKYLEQMTAMATVHLELRPVAAPNPIVDRPRWNPVITVTRALRAFVEVLQVIVNLMIYIVVFSPFVLVPVVLLVLVVRWIRRRQRARAVTESD